MAHSYVRLIPAAGLSFLQVLCLSAHCPLSSFIISGEGSSDPSPQLIASEEGESRQELEAQSLQPGPTGYTLRPDPQDPRRSSDETGDAGMNATQFAEVMREQ